MKNIIESSLLITLLLCLAFIVRTIWPPFFEWEPLRFVIDLLIILLGLIQLFLVKNSKINYKVLIRSGILTGLFSGLLTALLVYLYTNVIDPYYYEKLAKIQLAIYENEEGFDEYNAEQVLKAIGFMRRYNILSLGYIINNTIHAFATSLIISPFFVRNRQLV